MKHKIFNVLLRGGGLAGKFLLIFFLAKLLDPSDVGLYGLLTATISYSIYFVGLDFYTYASREMSGSPVNKWPDIIKNQVVLYGFSYLVVFPVVGLLFYSEVFPSGYGLIFCFLLVAEHFSQELNRMLVVSGKPLIAGIVLFFRMGGWCYALIFFYLFGYYSISLHFVFWSWFLSDVIAIAIGVFSIRDLPWNMKPWKIDIKWIIRGISVSSFLLIGTLALRGLFTVDRYFVGYYSGVKEVGVYTIYVGIAGSILNFVDAAVFSFKYPGLVASYRSGDQRAFLNNCHVFSKQVLVSTFLLALICASLILPVLKWIGKPAYIENIPVFFVILITFVVYVIGHIPHFFLYAAGYDKVIVRASLLGVFCFVFLGFVLGGSYGFMGVSTALLFSVFVIGMYKQWFSYRLLFSNKLKLLV